MTRLVNKSKMPLHLSFARPYELKDGSRHLGLVVPPRGWVDVTDDSIVQESMLKDFLHSGKMEAKVLSHTMPVSSASHSKTVSDTPKSVDVSDASNRRSRTKMEDKSETKSE